MDGLKTKIIELSEKGLSRAEIATYLGLSESTLKRRLKDLSIILPKRSFLKDLPPRDHLHDLYVGKSLSVNKIASEFDVRPETARRWLIHYGFTIHKSLSEINDNSLSSFTDLEVSHIVGTLLGDSWLSKRSKSFRMHMEHSYSQECYIRHKAALLGRIFTTDISEIKHVSGKKPNGRYLRATSRSLGLFSNLWYSFYGKGFKEIPESLPDIINFDVLSLWFGDDGSYTHDGSLTLFFGHPSTFSGTSDRSKSAAYSALESLGLQFSPTRASLGVDGVRFSLPSSLRLTEELKPRLPQCVHYKFKFVESRDNKPVFLYKKDIQGLTNKRVSEYINEVFSYYRSKGFPYPSYTKARASSIVERLSRIDYKSTVRGDEIYRLNVGSKLADSFFKELYSVEVGNFMSPEEAFDNDIIFREILENRIQYAGRITDASVLTGIKLHPKVKYASNFHPVFAASIYKMFDAERVWDMCGGFGGRMLGAYVAGVKEYYATDPFTYEGLSRLKDFLSYGGASVSESCAEDFDPPDNLDVCFTSPPFFNYEVYSDSPTQSYNKFPSKDSWLNNFIVPVIEKCHKALRKDGILALNIQSTPSYACMEEDVLHSVGSMFSLEGKMSLMTPVVGKVRFKKEPLYIFRKL